MTKEQYFKFAEEFMNESLEISKNKNADYAGNGDPFRNFTSVGHEWTEIGFYTRMMDKMSRIKSFIQNGTLHVKDESVKDTLQDLMNYCVLFAGYLESKYNPGETDKLFEEVIKYDLEYFYDNDLEHESCLISLQDVMDRFNVSRHHMKVIERTEGLERQYPKGKWKIFYRTKDIQKLQDKILQYAK